jgi:hypothetical protein
VRLKPSLGQNASARLPWLAVIGAIAYLALIAPSACQIHHRNAKAARVQTNQETSKGPMSASDLNWKTEINAKVEAKPSGLWTVAYEYVRGPALIRFYSNPTNQWCYAPKPASPATPDGDPTSNINSQRCLLPGAPVGALIAKIGGSTACQSDGKAFLVGSFAVIEIDAATSGPLYLTINDEATGMTNNAGQITVNIQMHPLLVASSTPPAPSVRPATPTASLPPTPGTTPPARQRGFPKAN